jgi:hypothetical protein
MPVSFYDKEGNLQSVPDAFDDQGNNVAVNHLRSKGYKTGQNFVGNETSKKPGVPVFIPDEEISDAVKTGKFDTPETWEAKLKQPEFTATQSALRGAAQGATFGFADEITAGAQSVFGDKTYKQARDENRNFDRASEEQNPNAYLGGNVAGGLATAVIPAGAAAGLGRMAAQGAAMGGVAGLGASEAEDLQGMVKDTAIGAGFGGAIPVGMNLAGKAISKVAKPLVKGVNKVAFDVDSDVTEALMNNPKALQGAKSVSGLEDDVVQSANRMKERVSQGSSEAWDTLGQSKLTNAETTKKTILESLEKNLFDKNHLKINPDGQVVANPLSQSQRVIKQAEAIKQYLTNTDLSEVELKKFVLSLDDEIDWDKKALKASNEFLKSIRHDVDQNLKSLNPDYKKAMEGVADDVSTLSATTKDFGLKKAVDEYGNSTLGGSDLTLSKVKTMKDSVGKDQLLYRKENLDKLDPNLNAEFEKARLAERASGGVTNGSRNSITGAVIGGAIGTAVGGPLGSIIGGAAGVAAGRVTDKYGRVIGQNLAKGAGITASKAKQALESKYGKYFKEGVGRSINSAGVTHYLLYSKDSEYRKLYDEAKKED